VIGLTASKAFLLSVLISLYLLPLVLSSQTTTTNSIWLRENHSTPQAISNAISLRNIEANQSLASSFEENMTGKTQGGGEMLQVSPMSGSGPGSFTSHMMCKGHDSLYNPIEPTTIFSPGDVKAECLTAVTLKKEDTVDFKWYYRNDSAKTWVFCYDWSYRALYDGEHVIAGYLLIAGYWPGTYYPRAYKVEVYYLNSSLLFPDFFEVTNGGINSPRMCESVDAAGFPVNAKSRFTIGNNPTAIHYLRFDRAAYINDELGFCHNLTTVWIQPDGSIYKTHSCSFNDYKDSNMSSNYWQYEYVSNDSIPINQYTPVGNWKVEVYIDRYLSNNTWIPYGPIATTPFIVGNATVADWTFMVYLDGDNSLENASLDVFRKMATVGSSPNVNIVVQMDRSPDPDTGPGNWTECYRFNVAQNMTPMPENAVLNLSEVDMGDSNTLKDFANWTISNYPANRYLLVLWDHGTGCIGVCFDVTNGSDFLTLPELSQALSGLPVVIDAVVMDACSMNMIEVAYQIKDYANVLIGPEGLGYAPAPYDSYLSDLTSNSSIQPNEFAKKVIADYMNWFIPSSQFPNATMSAIDLTKITSLMAAIDDFAINLKRKETPYHDKTSLARNQTEGYEGPTANEFGYYIDLYDFAHLAHQCVPDEGVQNAATQVMTGLSAGNALIYEDDKGDPNAHGLSIFFPNEKEKYGNYGGLYENTAFALDTPWDEFVKYYLDIQKSGFTLTIKTVYPYIPVEFDGEPYRTDSKAELRLFVLAGSYIVNVQTIVPTGSGLRKVFEHWDDDSLNTSKTIAVPGATLTYTASYESQYEVVFGQSGVGADFSGTVAIIDGIGYNATSLPVSFWSKEGTTHTFDFKSPLTVAPNVEQYVWTNTAGLSTIQSGSVPISAPGNLTGNYETQYHLTVISDYGPPTPTSGWFGVGELINATVTSPVSGSTGTRFVCTGWTGSGSVNASGTSTYVVFTINASSSITWNWKTQYFLVVRTDPAGLGPQPNVSAPGPWYDSGAPLTFTAQDISGKLFERWTVDGTDYERGVNQIILIIDRPYEVTAHYVNAPTWWETFSRPETQAILGLVGTGFIVAIASAAWLRNHRRKGLIETHPKPLVTEVPKATVTLPGRIAAGYEDLDNLLLGGLPENYAVALTSPSCDERGLLIRRFLEAGTKKGETTFYVTIDPGEAKSLAEEFQSNFYLFICNPRADTMVKSLPNIVKLKGVENLTEITIALTRVFRTLDTSLGKPKRACIEIISDILLQHHAVQTRRWLTDLIPELRSKGFTTLAVMNPQMHPTEEVQAILELFEGEISIYEKEDLQKVLKIKKMYNQRYMDCELSLRKERLEAGNKREGS
jgi:KaiC/GvpD/RAD55 family RecA-like ATPase